MPGELHMGPGQPEKFEVVLPFINDGVQTPLHGQSGQLNCEKPQLSRIGTFMHLSNHYITSLGPFNLLQAPLSCLPTRCLH